MNQEEQAILTPRPFTPMLYPPLIQHHVVMRMPDHGHGPAWLINARTESTTRYERNPRSDGDGFHNFFIDPQKK
jgi:hypothetical protein